MAITLRNIIALYILFIFPKKYLSINLNAGNTSLCYSNAITCHQHVQSHINRLRLVLLTAGSSKNLQAVFQRRGCHHTVTKPNRHGGETWTIAVAEVSQITSRRVFSFISDGDSFISVHFGAPGKLLP